MPTHRHFDSWRVRMSTPLLAAATSLLILSPGVALADWKQATIVDHTDRLIVSSNNASYHQVNFLAGMSADIRVQVNTGAAGRVKEWRVHFGLRAPGGQTVDFPTRFAQDSYPVFQRPRHVDRTVNIRVPANYWDDFARARCNGLADDLRRQGLGNAAIFGQDRIIKLGIETHLSADTTGAGSGDIVEEGQPLRSVDLVCQKFAGPTVPPAVGGIGVEPPRIVNSGIVLTELTSAGGRCRLKIEGYITTDRPNATVKFRYRDEAGRQSEVKTANTGANRMARFTDFYDLSTGAQGASGWEESGSIRMIGVEPGFQTTFAPYAMTCQRAGGQGGFAAAETPPKLSFRADEEGKVLVHGQTCPESLRLRATVTGRNSGYNGTAVVFGPGFLAPPRGFDIDRGQSETFEFVANLKWDNVKPPSNGGPMTQTRRFTFNVGKGDRVVTSTRDDVRLACRPVKVNPAVQPKQEFGVQPKNPGTGGAAPQ